MDFLTINGIAVNVDIKGHDCGYSVAPPSSKINKGEYIWNYNREDGPIAELPEAWCKWLHENGCDSSGEVFDPENDAIIIAAVDGSGVTEECRESAEWFLEWVRNPGEGETRPPISDGVIAIDKHNKPHKLISFRITDDGPWAAEYSKPGGVRVYVDYLGRLHLADDHAHKFNPDGSVRTWCDFREYYEPTAYSGIVLEAD